MPKVSIIIPTYNRAHMVIERAGRSALAQTFKDYEIIIVDDHSTDGTEELLKNFEGIRYIRMSENVGKPRAFNYALAQAKGKYVVCVDDDNELFSSFLEETVPLLDSAPQDVGAVTTGRMIAYQNEGYEDYAKPADGSTFSSIDWGWLMRREVFDVISYDETMYADEDADLGIQFHKHFRVIPLNRPLQIAYDSPTPEESVCFPTERRLRGLENYLRKNLKEYTDPNELRYILRLAGRNFYRGEHRLKGLHYFFKSFWAMKNIRSFSHFFFVLFGWKVYDTFMTIEERIMARRRMQENYL